MGYEHDRIQWMIQGVLIGVAVKIVRSEKQANNFGHRKWHEVRMSGVRVSSLRPNTNNPNLRLIGGGFGFSLSIDYPNFNSKKIGG